jgi:glyoxylase-like metal-dependent hydrolase (beta-lactamase superfamily II)
VSKRVEHESVAGIRVGRFGGKINTTCIVWRIGSSVIDTGPPNQWPAVRRFVRERTVERVLLTHHHEDHSGNAARIRSEFGVGVFAPPGAIPPLRDGFPLRPYQHVVWGRPPRMEAVPVPDFVDAGDGYALRAVHSPGHSPDMTCYLEPERGWLITGDLFLSKRTRYLRIDEDLSSLLASLRRILDEEFDTLFCSHRGVVKDGKDAIRVKLEGLEELCGKVRALGDEGRSEGEIARELLGREDLISWITGFHMSKRSLVRGCLRASHQDTSD